jgi:hypothetical protein
MLKTRIVLVIPGHWMLTLVGAAIEIVLRVDVNGYTYVWIQAD